MMPHRLTACSLFTIIVVGLVMFCGALTTAFGQGAPKRPAVLFLGSSGADKPAQLRTWYDWLASGFEIDVRDVSAVRKLADLKPFNVVVLNFLPPINTDGSVTQSQLVLEKVLGQYLRQGGGVTVFCGGGQWERMSGAVRHLLAPYGASVPEEQIVDPDHLLGVVNGRFKVDGTTQITAAPMTRGISLLGYIGQASRADAIKLMMPLVLKTPADWHVVVRGEHSAYSAEALKPGTSPALKTTPASYSSSPVMAAWRNVGTGRLFVFPQNVAQTVTSPGVFGNYLWRKNAPPGTPQNRSFIMQIVRWEAQPSLQSGRFGGYVTDRKLRPDDEYILKDLPPIDWAKAPTGDKLAPRLGSIRGLIGARSNLSGGSASISELCAAARKAGLGFLGFTEDLARLSPQKWEEVKAECRRNSDSHFLAIPGMLALDKEGNTWMALGWAAFPRPPAVTPDLKRLDNTYAFFFRDFNTRFVGFANVNHNPDPWYEMKQVSAFAVLTREHGKTVDEAESQYRQSCYNMENYIPFIQDQVTTPAEIAQLSKGMLTVFAGKSVADLQAYCQGVGPHKGSLFWEDPHPWYLSSGPRLDYECALRGSSFAVDQENENLYRYGLRLSGLQAGDSVLLWDGPTLFRQWRATGPVFTAEHTWPQEQVRSFIVEVKRGDRTVLLASPLTLQYGRRFNQCGDRQNTIPYNYQPDARGDWYVTGPPIGCHYKGWCPDTLVYGTYKSWAVGAIGIEYGPPYLVSWYTGPAIPFDSPIKEQALSLASYQYQRLSCPGIMIVDDITNRVYPDGGRHLGDCYPPKRTVPLRLFNLTQRRYGLYGMIGALNGQLVESKITALQDVALKNKQEYVRVASNGIPPDISQSVETDFGGKINRYRLADGARGAQRQKLATGDYVGVYPYGLAGGGAAYAVSGDLYSLLDIAPQHSGSSFLLKVPSQWHRGDQLKYSMLFTTGASLPQRPASDYEKVVRFLGLKGTFPAIKDLQGGTLLDEPVIATIKTTPEAVVTFDTVKNTDAPLSLTLRLRGFNPNWQAVYTLNGSSRWLFFGQLDGDCYFNLYTSRAAYQVRAGQPLLADNPRVHISLDDPAGRQAQFEIYNPTGEMMNVTVRTNPAFFKARSFKLKLAPYTSQELQVH